MKSKRYYSLLFVLIIFLSGILLIQCSKETKDTETDLRSLSDDFFLFRSYTVEPDRGFVTIHNENGTNAYAVPLPYGAHSAPMTGHAYGKSGPDWIGYIVLSTDEMTKIDDTYYGISKFDAEARIPYYSSPVDGLEIVSVQKADLGPVHNYYGDERYTIKAKIANGGLHIDHIRKLHESFIQKMTDAGNIDPRTWTGSGDENLITRAFTLAKGDYIAQPQMQAHDVPGFPDYIYRNITMPIPYMQIEYSWSINTNSRCIGLSPYYLTNESTREDFRRAIINGADNRDINGIGINYVFDSYMGIEWWWRAEIGLGKELADFNDHSSVTARLGDWWECQGDCPQQIGDIPGYTAGDILNDDIFVIFPVNKETDVYKSSLYSSPDVSYLVQKHKYRDGVWDWYIGEVIFPAQLDPVKGQMKIKWRILADYTGVDEYQGMSYYLDTKNKKLKIRWQPVHAATEAGIILPAIPLSSDIADGEELIQYNGLGRWFNYLYGIN